MNIEQPSIRAFLSYSHADDAEFGIVDPLVKKLKAYVRAKSGRALDIFVDRESIGWGTDWRESISSSVESATVSSPCLAPTTWIVHRAEKSSWHFTPRPRPWE